MGISENWLRGLVDNVAYHSRPEDIKMLKEAPGAYEYVIANLMPTLHEGESLSFSLGRASNMAVALGELGTAKDGEELAGALFLTVAINLKAGAQAADLRKLVDAMEGMPELGNLRLEAGYDHNLAEMIQTLAYSTANYMMESMVRLNAQSQAVDVLDKFARMDLAPNTRKSLAGIASALISIMKERNVDREFVKTAIAKMKPPAQAPKQAVDGAPQRKTKN